MTQSTDSTIKIQNKAEGSPGGHEQREPAHPLRTSTLPAVPDTSGAHTGETGIIMTVQLGKEGVDTSETQDSSLTKGETQLHPDKEPAADPQALNPEQVAVLIVEDTVELAEVIQATLESMGLQAVYETHGQNGLDKLKELNPQIVIMDIGLPDITGWKMLDHIKAHYSSIEAEMPTIIVITAYGDPANRLIGKLQNIHSYLIKPFTPDQVEQVVGMALRGERPEDPNIGGGASSSAS